MVSKSELNTETSKKKEWTSMEVTSLGKATDLIKGGGGKLSATGGDTGEGKKQKSG
jgi:hypothetical protein